MVESSDMVLLVGAVLTDYSTVGYTLLLSKEKIIKVETDR
jgi:TPP-dependent 2-oxoacid decarboxylase